MVKPKSYKDIYMNFIEDNNLEGLSFFKNTLSWTSENKEFIHVSKAELESYII